MNICASRGSLLEPEPRSFRTKPPDALWGIPWPTTRWVAGWRGRIRTFDLLIQSQVTDFRDSSPVVSTKLTDFRPESYRVW